MNSGHRGTTLLLVLRMEGVDLVLSLVGSFVKFEGCFVLFLIDREETCLLLKSCLGLLFPYLNSSKFEAGK